MARARPPTIETSDTPPATGGQIARGAAWLVLFKLADRSVGFVSTMVLARLLAPADFGLVAMAMAVVAMSELMSAFGFDTAIIQRQDARRAHYDTAWTFNVVFGVAVAMLLVLLSFPAAGFYQDPRLTPILQVLALGALVSGFENIGTVAFRKQLDFRSEFRFLLFKRLATFVVTIALAISFRDYWALIAGVVTGKLASVWISYRLHPFRPRLDLSARADLFHFSKWLLLSNTIQFIQTRSTDFIIGRTVGSHGLGIYTVAMEIATLPSTELIAPLNRAVYPAYSRLAHDPAALRERFFEVFAMIALIALPVAFGLAVVAEPAVRVLLGAKWLETVPIIRVAALVGLVGALQSNLYLVILALGRPRANTLLAGTIALIALPAIVIASLRYGIIGAAWANFGAAIVSFIGIGIVFTRITGYPIRRIAAALWRPTLAALLMAAAVLPTDRALIESGTDFAVFRLCLLIVIGSLTYSSGVLGCWWLAGMPEGAESRAVDLLLRRVRPHPPPG